MPQNLPPDLSERPFHLTIRREMRASPATLYTAWTEKFGEWFASQDSLVMDPEEGAPFYFETVFKSAQTQKMKRHPHYGRFLKLEKNHLIEMTWVTGAGGTEGAETLLRLRFEPKGNGTMLTLSHDGFATETANDLHDHAWRHILDLLDARYS